MRPFWKEIIFTLLTPFAGTLSGRASILMYHSISEGSHYFSAVSPENFRKQMRYLKDGGFIVMPLAELVSSLALKKRLPPKTTAITFDDGYQDNLTEALPILQKYNFPATIFIMTSAIGKVDKRGFVRLSEGDLRELHATGLIDIEPHTVTHPKLTQCAPDEMEREIKESKQVLEMLLGKPCALFAYPYGDYNEKVREAAMRAGFRGAVTVNAGTVGQDDDALLLQRNSIDSKTTMIQFAGKVSHAIDIYEHLKIWK